MANSLDPDQTVRMGAVCSWSTLFASVLNTSVMLGNYLQQTTSADDILDAFFFLALLGLRYKLRRILVNIINRGIVYNLMLRYFIKYLLSLSVTTC